jgi:pyridoxine 5-phosphate synthase
MPKLGVNIDHIATLRQARMENFPDPVEAALEAEAGGADGIVCHLREDRRHIQERDVIKLKERIRTRLDLEMAATGEMLNFALRIKPAMVTLVPEKRLEVTTEGGLNVRRNFEKLAPLIEKIQNKNILVSIFIDPDEEQILAAARTTAKFVEIHTGRYVNAKRDWELLKTFGEVKRAITVARAQGLRVNAGHGLDYSNVSQSAQLGEIEELNIGFSIVARSVYVGIRNAVAEMKAAINS